MLQSKRREGDAAGVGLRYDRYVPWTALVAHLHRCVKKKAASSQCIAFHCTHDRAKVQSFPDEM